MNEQYLNKLKKVLDGEFGTIVEKNRYIYSAQQSFERQGLYKEEKELKGKIKNPLAYRTNNSDNDSFKNIAISRLEVIKSELAQIQNKKNEINGILEKIEHISEEDITKLQQENEHLRELSLQFPEEFTQSIFSEIDKNNLLIDFTRNNDIADLKAELEELNVKQESLENEKNIAEKTVTSLSSNTTQMDFEQYEKDRNRLDEINKIYDESIPYLRPIDINDLIDLYNDELDNDTIIHRYGLQNTILDLDKDDPLYDSNVKNKILDQLSSNLIKHIKIVKQEDLDELYDSKVTNLSQEIASLSEKVGDNENYVLTVEEVNNRIMQLREEERYYKARIKSLSSMLAIENSVENRKELDQCFEVSQEKHDYIEKYTSILKEIKKGKKFIDGFAKEDDKAKLSELQNSLSELSSRGPLQIESIVNSITDSVDTYSPVTPVVESDEIIVDNSKGSESFDDDKSQPLFMNNFSDKDTSGYEALDYNDKKVKRGPIPLGGTVLNKSFIPNDKTEERSESIPVATNDDINESNLSNADKSQPLFVNGFSDKDTSGYEVLDLGYSNTDDQGFDFELEEYPIFARTNYKDKKVERGPIPLGGTVLNKSLIPNDKTEERSESILVANNDDINESNLSNADALNYFFNELSLFEERGQNEKDNTNVEVDATTASRGNDLVDEEPGYEVFGIDGSDEESFIGNDYDSGKNYSDNEDSNDDIFSDMSDEDFASEWEAATKKNQATSVVGVLTDETVDKEGLFDKFQNFITQVAEAFKNKNNNIGKGRSNRG